MSNQRRLRRSAGTYSADAATAAARYRCGHCNARMRIRKAGRRVLMLDVFHEETCPVLRGQVSSLPGLLRAIGEQ